MRSTKKEFGRPREARGGHRNMAGLHHCHGAQSGINEDASTLSVYRGVSCVSLHPVFKERWRVL